MRSVDLAKPSTMTHCPQCEHLLRGLPPTGVCPECGLEYDPDCEVIRLHPLTHDSRPVVLAAFLLAVLAICVHGLLTRLEPWLLAGVVCFMFLVRIHRLARYTWSLNELILNRAGVEWRGAGTQPRRVAWSEFEYATVTWLWSVSLVLVDRCERKVLSYSAGRLGGRVATRDCADRINQKRPIYLSAAMSGSR